MLQVVVHDEVDVRQRLDDGRVGVATGELLGGIVEDLGARQQAIAVARRHEGGDGIGQVGDQVLAVVVDIPAHDLVTGSVRTSVPSAVPVDGAIDSRSLRDPAVVGIVDCGT